MNSKIQTPFYNRGRQARYELVPKVKHEIRYLLQILNIFEIKTLKWSNHKLKSSKQSVPDVFPKSFTFNFFYFT